MSLGDETRSARLAKAWSQRELAEAAGVSRPTIARVESGDDVSTATLEKIAGALGLRLVLQDESVRGVQSRVALPEPVYLARIGELAYSVSSIEWMLLGDLQTLSDRLPESLTLAALEPQTTGSIAARVKHAAETLDEGEARDYLAAVAEALGIAAGFRNDVLHARPATHPTQGQRLARAEVAGSKTTGKRFWIDDEWFERALESLNQCLSAVNSVRPSR